MAGSVDWTPSFSPTSIPTLPSLTLTEDEKRTIGWLQSRGQGIDRFEMELANAYFMGEQLIDNLEIAIPKDLAAKLRTLVGWARIAVDPYVERLAVEGFRLPGDTDVNRDLAELWSGNGLDAEAPLAFTDALALRRAYWMVGAGEAGGPPKITVESPLNVAVMWDVTGRRAEACIHHYMHGSEDRASLMLPNRTIDIARDHNGQWVKTGEDKHGFGYVPMVRMANNPRTYNRDGFSEITPELRSIIDGACRTLLGLEVARELYSVPQKLLLGATESDFQTPSGQVRRAWDTYINHILALERDDEGNLPEVRQLTAYDPSTFTKLIEMYASQAAGILSAVPQDLGLYTQGNPVSAEAYEATETRRNRRAMLKQAQFGVAITEAMKLAIRFQNNGELPDKYGRLAIDWQSVHTMAPLNPDAVGKMVAAQVLPARSDVTLKRLGITPEERVELEKDFDKAAGQQNLAAIRQGLADTAQQAANGPQKTPGGAVGAPNASVAG
ncbi:hypothetical protein GCM10027053_51900 [Intrasporangium mesophilum]